MIIADMAVATTTEKCGYLEATYGGLTKREYFAAMAMQGLCSDCDDVRLDEVDLLAAGVAGLAVKMADALLAKLEESK